MTITIIFVVTRLGVNNCEGRQRLEIFFFILIQFNIDPYLTQLTLTNFSYIIRTKYQSLTYLLSTVEMTLSQAISFFSCVTYKPNYSIAGPKNSSSQEDEDDD